MNSNYHRFALAMHKELQKTGDKMKRDPYFRLPQSDDLKGWQPVDLLPFAERADATAHKVRFEKLLIVGEGH